MGKTIVAGAGALAPDAVLGPLAPALDGDAVAELVPGCSVCRPVYVRYKPGHHLQVLYEIDGTLGHLMLVPPRRAERLWARIADSGLLERGKAWHLPGMGAVMQMYPVDVRLPGLSAPELGGAQLIRYKPGKRAVLRLGPGVFGKLRADDAGPRLIALGRAVGALCPTPLEYRPELRMTTYRAAPGTRLALLRGTELERWMAPVADALARLHATPAPGLAEFSVAREVDELRAAGELAAALLGRSFEALVERLAAELAAAPAGASTIHGSFHDDQVLVGYAGVVLLDLDSAARGHPALDVGHFACYLSAAGEAGARERWLAACAAGPEALLFEAASLVRWSSLPFRRLEPRWREAMERSLRLAHERLSEYSGSR